MLAKIQRKSLGSFGGYEPYDSICFWSISNTFSLVDLSWFFSTYLKESKASTPYPTAMTRRLLQPFGISQCRCAVASLGDFPIPWHSPRKSSSRGREKPNENSEDFEDADDFAEDEFAEDDFTDESLKPEFIQRHGSIDTWKWTY